MHHIKIKQPTLKTWLRAQGKLDIITSSHLQNRRVRKLQIQEAIRYPEWFTF
jgi:hypothetical protein